MNFIKDQNTLKAIEKLILTSNTKLIKEKKFIIENNFTPLVKITKNRMNLLKQISDDFFKTIGVYWRFQNALESCSFGRVLEERYFVENFFERGLWADDKGLIKDKCLNLHYLGWLKNGFKFDETNEGAEFWFEVLDLYDDFCEKLLLKENLKNYNIKNF